MKKICSIIVLFTLAYSISFAQKAATPKVVTHKAHNEGWLVSVQEAFEVSEKTGKPIMANFTGSDWCGWCKRLTANVFDHKEFKDWAAKNVVLLELDYPRRSQLPEEIVQQNAGMQQAFSVGGYPTIWLFKMKKDKEQFNIIPYGKTGYAPDVAQFTSAANQIIAQGKASSGS
jgi:thiol:disulfide interchange protein